MLAERAAVGEKAGMLRLLLKVSSYAFVLFCSRGVSVSVSVSDSDSVVVVRVVAMLLLLRLCNHSGWKSSSKSSSHYTTTVECFQRFFHSPSIVFATFTYDR